MPICELRQGGVPINTIMIADDCIVLTQDEARQMLPEWFAEWPFYILPDSCDLVLVPERVAAADESLEEAQT